MAVDPSVRRLKRPVAVWLKKEKQYEFREECPYVGRKDGIVSRQFEVGGETLEKNVVVLRFADGETRVDFAKICLDDIVCGRDGTRREGALAELYRKRNGTKDNEVKVV